jgi:lipoprotein-anchoring transpeptidase ErfK/SrfK
MTRRVLLVAIAVLLLLGGSSALSMSSQPAQGVDAPPTPVTPEPEPQPQPQPEPQPAPPAPAPEPEPAPAPQFPPLPEDSGSGRRVVYSVGQQRVWLVEADEVVSASWLVSGRRGIPNPGTYSIYSRSRWSSASGGRVRMEFMLRFVKTKGLPIGFHSIPVDRRGRQIQSEDELGQPRSKGCVRQRRADAEHLWNWAPDGTVVRVTR